MTLENLALTETHNFPLKHVGNVHNGKVRSVYWITPNDSSRIIKERGYPVLLNSQLGVLITSDRISAFDQVWQSEDGLKGVPGKGVDLNVISKYWFDEFNIQGLAGNHILDVPHPLVWIVQRAEPILVEGVARQYITGSMWRAYEEKGTREFCGNILPEDLKKNQKLPDLLLTPTTKGNQGHIPGIPEGEDAKLTRQIILDNWNKLGFKSIEDVSLFEKLIREAYLLNSRKLEDIGQLLADDKKECGYVKNLFTGKFEMIYIDEATTPDSSRFWDSREYYRGKIIESCKEPFRQFLLLTLNRDILLNDSRFEERTELAKIYRVPVEEFMKVSNLYRGIAKKITGKTVPKIENPREEILDALNSYGIVV